MGTVSVQHLLVAVGDLFYTEICRSQDGHSLPQVRGCGEGAGGHGDRKPRDHVSPRAGHGAPRRAAGAVSSNVRAVNILIFM